MLNKDSHIPIYIQIEDELKQRIYLGDYEVGKPIPSERDLSKFFEVSRMTVRQAITNLVTDGLLYREKGKGTYVAAPKLEQPLTGLTSFTEDMLARGLIPSSKLIKFEKKVAPADIARELQLQETDEVYHIVRIRNADDQPMAIERNYLPVKLFPNLSREEIDKSLYHLIEDDYNLKIGKAIQKMEAALVAKEDSKFLQLEPNAVVLVIIRISSLEDGRPFEVVRSSYRADRYKFITEIKR